MALTLALREQEKIHVECSCGNKLLMVPYPREGYSFPNGSVRIAFTGEMKVFRTDTEVKNPGELYSLLNQKDKE